MQPRQGNPKTYKILMTGGHAATTALSMVEEFIRRSKKSRSWDIYWVGVESAFEGKRVQTLESKIFKREDVTYYPIIAGRIQRRITLWSLTSLAKIPIGFFHAFFILKKVKPDVILSFGGFAAFPVVVLGSILKIPIVIHEQTSAAGLANRLSSFFADKIALARRQSREFFPRQKTYVVGNPIMTQIAEISPKKHLGLPPTIYVTGGSRGARAINDLVEKILPRILTEFKVVHHTGYLDFKKFEKIKADLPKNVKENYEVYESIDPMQIDGVYRQADIIIARAGANTVAEIMSLKLPAILIPLPISYKDEQRKNAENARAFGIATLVEQDVGADKLLGEIYKTRANWKEIVDKVKNKKSPDRHASAKLADLVEELVV